MQSCYSVVLRRRRGAQGPTVEDAPRTASHRDLSLPTP
jgi:hypothetical protein